ncbi:MAG: HAD family hydrolase [Tannerella sp.]|jgi:putative hydrolase of the HAD superfamily|nr:HAD family hydrolase [Tannerella sp.]
MIDLSHIQGILFDYGGTIDSNGVHWAEVIWQAYQAENVPVAKDIFREAYVHGERTLGKQPIIQPQHTFADMLRIKIDIQMEWLNDGRFLPENAPLSEWKRRIADRCYASARIAVEHARPIIEELSERYPLVLVSNFYGNITSVLKDFRLDAFFPGIIESAVVGIRKPDPQIFRLGVERLQLPADKVVVIGDSYDKDILPARSIGCKTVWLKNTGWKESTGDETEADVTISGFTELKPLFKQDISSVCL